MVRRALERERGRRRGTVGLALAIGIGELEGRQTRIAPELFGIDAALLECGVHPWLQDLVGHQVDDQHLEVRARPDGLGQRAHELRGGDQYIGQIRLVLHQHVTDRLQLFQNVIQVRIVVDESGELLGERSEERRVGKECRL